MIGHPAPLPRLIDDLGLGARPLIGLDFDGTLAPIAATPDQAHILPAARDAVRRLAAGTAVCVVSGRDPSDVRARVGARGIAAYAGSHGLDMVDGAGRPFADGPTERFDALLPLLDETERTLRSRFAGTEGVTVERKRLGVAVHFRLRPEAEGEVAAAVDEVVRFAPSLRVQTGKAVVEARPAVDWTKGSAIEWLIDRLGPFTGALYAGDDATDEDAFRAVAGSVLGVLVAAEPRPSAAHFMVRDPAGLAQLLAALADRLA
jgi:trehalose-phosphatase